MITVKNLCYSYLKSENSHKKTLENINFCVKNNETLGIIGKSGSGKSTLAKLLNGLLYPDSGEIFLDNLNICKKTHEFFSQIGLVFQYPEHQFFENTVYDEIAFGLKNKNISKNEIKSSICKISNILGFNDNFLLKNPLNLSGGEKRLCAIAGVLVMEPEILILDEPTVGLGFANEHKILELLKKYQKKTQCILIFISHNMEEVVYISQKILVLDEGKQIFFDNVKNVFKQKNELEKLGLDIPDVTKIMSIVKNKFNFIEENILNIDQANKNLIKIIKRMI